MFESTLASSIHSLKRQLLFFMNRIQYLNYRIYISFLKFSKPKKQASGDCVNSMVLESHVGAMETTSMKDKTELINRFA
jgi:hypothetical protein